MSGSLLRKDAAAAAAPRAAAAAAKEAGYWGRGPGNTMQQQPHTMLLLPHRKLGSGWGSGSWSQVAAAAQDAAAAVRESGVKSKISDTNSNFVGLRYALDTISTSDEDQPVNSDLSGYSACLRVNKLLR